MLSVDRKRPNRIRKSRLAAARALNGFWYADIGYPIAGAFFFCMGLLIFATASLNPVPWWRTSLTAAVGLGTAIGFFLALHGDTIFASYVLWHSDSASFPGSMMTFSQGFLGIAAGVLLVMLAALELRHRILNPGPGRRDLSKATTISSDPASAQSDAALNRGPSYLRWVLVPTLAIGVVLLVLAGVCMYAFSPPTGTVNPGEWPHLQNPRGDSQNCRSSASCGRRQRSCS